MDMMPKDDIPAHTMDMVMGGKINTYPIVAIIQGKDLTYPEGVDLPAIPTVMVITRKSDNEFDVWWIGLNDVRGRDFMPAHYGVAVSYEKALIRAISYATEA